MNHVLCTVSRHCFCGLALAALQIGSIAAAVPAPAAYVKGSFQFVDFTTYYVGATTQTESQWGTITFDGVGTVNISYISDTDNQAARDVIANNSGSTSYQVSPDGIITIGTNGTTARLSADGNSMVLSSPAATNGPEIAVAIRIGAISNFNLAAGLLALNANTTGLDNNAVGSLTLLSNTTGNFNNAVGYSALAANTSGSNNNAQGSNALLANTTGYGNSAVGANSMLNLTSGFRNVGVGNNTGAGLVAGSYNTYIGWGVSGSADETGVTRIGNPTYDAATFIAGIASTPLSGAQVVITPSGQLGVLASSERYKTDIEPITVESRKLSQLRPVRFHLKSEPGGALQYGLIAEQVASVYPELVIHDASGTIQGVRYDELAPLLLEELQIQRQHMDEMQKQIEILQSSLKVNSKRASQ
jgi:hypothetical protein